MLGLSFYLSIIKFVNTVKLLLQYQDSFLFLGEDGDKRNLDDCFDIWGCLLICFFFLMKLERIIELLFCVFVTIAWTHRIILL